jgi:hypothetical protein
MLDLYLKVIPTDMWIMKVLWFTYSVYILVNKQYLFPQLCGGQTDNVHVLWGILQIFVLLKLSYFHESFASEIDLFFNNKSDMTKFQSFPT